MVFFLNAFLTRPELLDVSESCSQLAKQGSSMIVLLYCRHVPGLNIKEILLMFYSWLFFCFVLISPPSLLSPTSFPPSSSLLSPSPRFLLVLFNKALLWNSNIYSRINSSERLSFSARQNWTNATPEAWPHTSIEEGVNKYELHQGWPSSLLGDGIGSNSGNTEFLASGFQFSL